MTSFNALMLLTLPLAALAVVRCRPGALMIALNQMLTLRALEHLQAYGRPASESFLPEVLFTRRNFEIAGVIFAIATAMLAVSLVIPARKPRDKVARFVPLPRWTLVVVGLYLLEQTFDTAPLSSGTYLNDGGNVLGVSMGGVNALVLSLLLYEIVRRNLLGRLRAMTGFLILAAVMFCTSYSKGSTGLVTGYGMVAAVMLWPIRGRLLSRQSILSVALVVLVGLMAYVVRGVRQFFFEGGIATVTHLLETSGELEANQADTAEGLEKGGNGTQYACHVLECIQIYESGRSREWRSVYDPLLYTFEPSFLLGPMGITRPREAAWEIGDYYIGGGGVYVLGELYWNGGFVCLVIVFAALLVFTFWCDTRFRYSVFWLMMSAQFVPSLFMGVGYGFDQIARGAFNGLLVIGAYRLGSRLRLASGPQPIGSPSRFRLSAPRPLSRSTMSDRST